MRLVSCLSAASLLYAGVLTIGCSPSAAPSPAVKNTTKQRPASTSEDFPPLAAPVAVGQSAARSQSTSDAFPPLAGASGADSPADRPLREIDETRAAAAGIRKLAGRHLVLFTDVAADPSVAELPAVFDAAFPQWCQHLGLDAQANVGWQMRGFLIKDRERFEAAGLWPADLPQFLNGYTRRREFWLFNQSSEYYRRHLMLHEGVHGIMFTLQQSNGPAWYMEGLAELLATHRWSSGKLTLPDFPAQAADVPKLGRIEIVQAEFKQGQAKYLRDVLALKNRVYLDNGPYAWSWAAAAFLYGHPVYRDRFRALMKRPVYGDFNETFKQAYARDARPLGEEWQVFVSELAHGYDFERTRLDFSPAKTTPKAGAPMSLKVAADRGWQNTGLRLEANKRYALTASGRYTLATEPKPWLSEPGGVTIRYHRGLPLGILLAVVRPDEAGQGPSPFYSPHIVGLSATIEPKQTGTLYLRINDFAGELADNSGAAEVVVNAE
ncbi:MAG: hypothetical protein WD894_14640 [Pirellulales bacterium]